MFTLKDLMPFNAYLMKQLPIFVGLLLLFSCGTETQETAPPKETTISSPTLQEAWATDTVLRTPESVLYDRVRDVIYVANVNMNPWEKDGNGFISRLDAEGNVLDLEWITGLNGPKGMGVRDNSLFVADIDEVVEIDIAASTILNRYPVAGTPTLNDITVYEGTVYVSGSDSNKIFELTDDGLTVILEGELGRPNGLFAEADRLLMITSSSSQLLSIDKDTKTQTPLVDSLGHGDGIVPVGNGDYLASSWRGEVFYISSDWQRTQLLDTRDAKINAADIDYVIEKNWVLVPTFFDNRVVAYQLVK